MVKQSHGQTKPSYCASYLMKFHLISTRPQNMKAIKHFPFAPSVASSRQLIGKPFNQADLLHIWNSILNLFVINKSVRRLFFRFLLHIFSCISCVNLRSCFKRACITLPRRSSLDKRPSQSLSKATGTWAYYAIPKLKKNYLVV